MINYSLIFISFYFLKLYSFPYQAFELKLDSFIFHHYNFKLILLQLKAAFKTFYIFHHNFLFNPQSVEQSLKQSELVFNCLAPLNFQFSDIVINEYILHDSECLKLAEPSFVTLCTYEELKSVLYALENIMYLYFSEESCANVHQMNIFLFRTSILVKIYCHFHMSVPEKYALNFPL